MNAKTREQLEQAYLVVFDGFSASRSEVADALGVSKSVATSRLNKLRDAGLVATVDVNEESQGSARSGAFKEVEWQANETYDSISREEAQAKFTAAFPTEEPEAKPAKRTVKRGASKKAEAKDAPAKAPKSKLTKAQLTRAAKLRAEGATWNAIRAEFGVKYGSTRFFRLWEAEGIDHIPAGQRGSA